jgi:serine/threonine protein phosphatase PrpC
MPVTRRKRVEAVETQLAPLYTDQVEKSDAPRSLDDVSKSPSREAAVYRGLYTQLNAPRHHDNEDRLMYNRQHYGWGDFHAYATGVLDGHDGAMASQFLSDSLPPLLLKKIFASKAQLGPAITSAFDQLESELEKTRTTSGSCVALNCLFGRYIINANLGDCRVAYVPLNPLDQTPQPGKFTWLSRDMKASSPHERDRIRACGGQVIDGRVAGILEPSRTIGDFDVKARCPKNTITPIPELRLADLLTTGRRADDTSMQAGGAAVIVSATDGVWDECGAAEIAAVVNANMSGIRRLQEGMGAAIAHGKQSQQNQDASVLTTIATQIVKTAVEKGSGDDCTCEVLLVMCAGQ